MQLIWVSGPTGRIQTFLITARQVMWLVGAFASAMVWIGLGGHWVGVRLAIEMNSALAQSMGGDTTASEQMRLEAGCRAKLEADQNEIAAQAQGFRSRYAH